MTDDLVCPTCRTEEHLSGAPRGELIHLTCASCGLEWDRDPAPRCGSCGSADVRAVPQAVMEKSRGTQLSIVSIRVIHLCTTCDAELLARQMRTNTPVPPDENPAGGMR